MGFSFLKRDFFFFKRENRYVYNISKISSSRSDHRFPFLFVFSEKETVISRARSHG